MRIKDAQPFQTDVKRDTYRLEEPRKQSPEKLVFARTYVARLIKDRTSDDSYAEDYEVYLQGINYPKPKRRWPWRLFASKDVTVELVPVAIGTPDRTAITDGTPITPELISPEGNLYVYTAVSSTFFGMRTKRITGHLLPKPGHDSSADGGDSSPLENELPMPGYDPDVKAWEALSL